MRKTTKFKPRIPSLEDRFQEQVTKAATKGLTAALKPLVEAHSERLLRTLTPAEAEAAAVAAITGYILERQRLEELADELNDPVDDIGIA